MSSSFDFWPKYFRAPLSGDIIQAITPRFLSPDIKGNPEIEMQVQTEIASFGKQLGKILEAIEFLAKEAKLQDASDLSALFEIKQDIDQITVQHRTDAESEAIAALEKLKKTDEKAWQALLKKSRKTSHR